MSNATTLAPEAKPGSYFTYATGFILSVILTIAAYVVITHHNAASASLAVLLLSLAVVQLVVQLVFFLHLGREKKPWWNSLAFTFMLGVVLIIVIGTLWIMCHLNYRMMMSPTDMAKYLNSQNSL